MPIPHENDIKIKLLTSLERLPNGTLFAQDAYRELAEFYPQLTWEEKNVPYRNSKSKFANTVQFAREIAAKEGYIFRPNDSDSPGRGFWKITEKGRQFARSIAN